MKTVVLNIDEVKIPTEVVTCPVCRKGAFTIYVNTWTQNDDGTLSANDFDVECENEWTWGYDAHNWSDRTCALMSDVEVKIKEWVNQNCKFDFPSLYKQSLAISD